MYVTWEKPRRFTVRVYVPNKRMGGTHYTVGIVAMSVAAAVEAAQRIHPEGCVQSVNDTGAVDYVVEMPEVELETEKQ